jgi:hypothetical protein
MLRMDQLPNHDANTVAIPDDCFTSILLKNSLFWRKHMGFVAGSATQIPASSPHMAKMGAGSG